ncbi:MAG: M23 family metallopeptidase [Ignavibacteria bacterium]|nr:M23 family metallopeptidase [Ignavibacteria bacterium]
MKMYIFSFCCMVAFFNACSPEDGQIFSPYSPTESRYVLPYPIGTAYTCMQSWNGPYSHQDVFYYSVDFSMPVGTVVTASREGTVFYYYDSFYDNDATEGHENILIISHGDSTYSRYIHLTYHGVRVKTGSYVHRGDTLGYSGKSGTPIAHLHFDVTKVCYNRDCQTIPFLFCNTGDQPFGPKTGYEYQAWPYK